MSENGQVQVLIGMLKQAGQTLHGTMQGVESDVAHHVPGGTAVTIAANAAHAITGMDGIILGLVQGRAPVMMSEPTGLSTPPPMGGDWGDWGQTVEIDMPVFEAYAGKVMEATEKYLSTLTNDDLQQMKTSPTGNEMSAARWIGIAVLNTAWHTGEIAALKGTHGLKGYPF